MITLEQIKAAHAKVKSGADFPAYIQDIKRIGVTHYETFVSDGHAVYHAADGRNIASTPQYDPIEIAATCNPGQFQTDLLAHQQGKTDYLRFCNDCARSGVEKWIVRIDEMTCAYYDKAGKLVLVERIPQ
ncbi:MAG: DUF1398 domain-containing protein [Williamsia sp.]|nr:DUF1398 domain-containing protein [Williamsia sp.]